MCSRGLAAFYIAARPTENSVAIASPAAWTTTTSAVGAAIVIGLLVGLRAAPAGRAVLFGIATGCAEAMMAVISKAFGDRIGDGVAGTFLSWEPYVLVGCGISTLLVVQSAYQVGRPTIALPVITVTEPVVATLVGVGMFGERIHFGSRGACSQSRVSRWWCVAWSYSRGTRLWSPFGRTGEREDRSSTCRVR